MPRPDPGSSTAYRPAAAQQGVSLLELVLVLIVIGLGIAAGAFTLPWINEERSLEETRRVMTETRHAVLAFSLTNNRLPCPANPALAAGDAGFGNEDCSLASGFVPHEAMLLSGQVLDQAHRPVVYSVYRNGGAQADLAVVVNLFDGVDEPNPVLNVHDYCRALQNADAATGTAFTSVSTSLDTGGCTAATALNQAFVLASAGLEDADGNTNPFDGYNADAANACFAAPQQGRSASYDDLVAAVSFTTILGKVCP